jgi:hypothetical protein
VERLICEDPSLGQLNTSLASVLKDTQAALPNRADSLLADQHRWSAALDKQCIKKRAPQEAMSGCLADAYRARIAELNGLLKDASARSKTASCQALADRYRFVADAHPLDSPLMALAAPGSGLTLAVPVGAFKGTASDLADWGAAQPPPFTISGELTQALPSIGGNIDKLPNANLYSIDTERGDAHCVESLFFAVTDGVAQQVNPPPGFEDESPACGVRRVFGTIDSTPVLLEETYDQSPAMQSSIKVASWGADRFVAACKVSFAYTPRFPYRTLSDWSHSCTAYECQAMQTSARQLAIAAQKSPANLQRKVLGELTPEQLQVYNDVLQTVPGESEMADDRDPATLTEGSPLRLPYTGWGKLYLVSLFHFTNGAEFFSDWRVRFEKIEDGRLEPAADLAVGMDKGGVHDVSIVSLMPNY